MPSPACPGSQWSVASPRSPRLPVGMALCPSAALSPPPSRNFSADFPVSGELPKAPRSLRTQSPFYEQDWPEEPGLYHAIGNEHVGLSLMAPSVCTTALIPVLESLRLGHSQIFFPIIYRTVLLLPWQIRIFLTDHVWAASMGSLLPFFLIS